MKKVFIAGEGPNDLGSWAKEPQDREPSYPGVVESLLLRVNPSGWMVSGSRRWKHIRKYVANSPAPTEKRNVLGIALEAVESGCDVLAFVRDRDGPKNRKRQQDIEEGVQEAQEMHGQTLCIIGGMAIERIESWLCALLCGAKSEKMGKSKVDEFLAGKVVKLKDTSSMVDVVENAELDKIPRDAVSLRSWLDAANASLCEST
jgi:hypothetical protein